MGVALATAIGVQSRDLGSSDRPPEQIRLDAAVGSAAARVLEAQVAPGVQLTAIPTAVDATVVRRAVAPSATAAGDIPFRALLAYQNAAAVMAEVRPECHLDWTLLAAVGKVESDHGRFGGAALLPDGVSRPAIVGVPLDGRGAVSALPDTDAGRLDGDRTWDRAVGAMQFVPSTWAIFGVDGDGDGVRSPQDIDDAALAAAAYLCAGSPNLARPADLRGALLRYNASEPYADLVMAYERYYRASLFTVSLARPVTLASRVSAPESEPSATERTRTSHEEPATSPEVSTGAPATAEPEAAPTVPTVTPAATPGETTSPDEGTPPPPAEPDPTTEPDPTAGDPEPSTDPSSDPSTVPDPSPDAGDGSQPPATSDPAAVTETGTWTACADGFCLDDQPLDVSLLPEADYDGDGTAQAPDVELAALVGRTVTLEVLEDGSLWTVLGLTVDA